MPHTSFGKSLTIMAIRSGCGHTGQNKPSALDKMERLEKQEMIGKMGNFHAKGSVKNVGNANKCHQRH